MRVNYRRLADILKILASVWKCDYSFSWFASGHSAAAVLFSKLLGKKSIVIAGGYDVACVPEINYGQFTRTWDKRLMTLFSLRFADLVLSVSESTNREALRWAQPKKITVIYNGVDIDSFSPGGKKEDLVITVGGVSHSNLQRKGLETFVKSARLVPEARFVVIGKEQDDSINILRSIASPNVRFAGFVSDQELLQWYQRAKVYVQASAHEGFGISLAEAMLCQCVPVVTNRGALPEVVGDTGFYVPFGDEEATAQGIKTALQSDKGTLARKRIEDNFGLTKRETALLKMVDSLH
ncbi:MAG: glycosyltransferase family 4 protein [Methanothrix sp.]|nr:glycosyltransferase family 4 protein [Methanothrix sp.]